MITLNCDPHDQKWANDILRRLPVEARNRAIAGYNKVIADLTEKHTGEIACENIARREANTRLRGYFKSVMGREP